MCDYVCHFTSVKKNAATNRSGLFKKNENTTIQQHSTGEWNYSSAKPFYVYHFHNLFMPGKYHFKQFRVSSVMWGLLLVLQVGVYFFFSKAHVYVGSIPSEIEMYNEQRQQATCYHFKYFPFTYPVMNINK